MQDHPADPSIAIHQSIARPPLSTPRMKNNAAAQTVPETSTSTRTSTKHARFAEDDREAVPAQKRLAVEVKTPHGRKLIHINLNEYVAHPFDLVTEAWVTESNARHLYKILGYNNEGGYWFPVHRVPAAGSWAVVDENPSVMHRVRLGRPLLVWIVGISRDVHLSPPREGTNPTLHATIDFVRDIDRSQVISIHNAAATIALPIIDRLSVKLQTHNEVYDARQKIQRKAAMLAISPGRILAGDIVLLECTIVRREDGTRTVTFVLNSIYWLLEKPRPPTIVTQPMPEFPDVISID
ncbi:hypothetical protein C8T65DRAFT_695173 [Cerioporus squamosus]|nr:hypothetical protein C8T65DRAFT_695173 [Cerioporus squamosus]